MRPLFKWTLRSIVILALLLAGLAYFKRAEITRLLAVNSLFSEEKIVGNFSHMGTLFETAQMTRGPGPVSALPRGDDIALPAEVRDWIDARAVTSLLVLKDGKIVYEDYFLGTGPDDRRISWSVAKSFLSALIGIVLDEGKIGSIDDQVVEYAPQLKGSAYDGARIVDVLQMESGVAFNEDYLDFNSDINRMGRVLALGRSMDGFAAGLDQRFAPPGETWRYVSIDTHVLGMVVRGATGRSIPDLMQEKLLWPMGIEADPYYLTDGYGVAFVLGGLNMVTRDYARLGQLFLQSGRLNGRQIVPADWVAASTTPSAKTAPGELRYGYQWWVPQDGGPGEFFARGIYGQHVYVNRDAGVVIATTAADRHFEDPGVTDQNTRIFRLIAETVR